MTKQREAELRRELRTLMDRRRRALALPDGELERWLLEYRQLVARIQAILDELEPAPDSRHMLPGLCAAGDGLAAAAAQGGPEAAQAALRAYEAAWLDLIEDWRSPAVRAGGKRILRGEQEEMF